MTPIIKSFEHLPGDSVRMPAVFVRLRNGFALSITPSVIRINYAGELSDRELAARINALGLPFEVYGRREGITGWDTEPMGSAIEWAKANQIRLKPIEIALPRDIEVPAKLWNYPILGQVTESVSWTRREVQPAQLRIIGGVLLSITDTQLVLSSTDGSHYQTHTFPAL
jgi:hypothetical protein